MTSRAEKIAQLNDALRKKVFWGNGAPGSVVMTIGIRDRGNDFTIKALIAVRDYSDFTPDNNPHGERDMGFFEIDGVRCLWSMSYHDSQNIDYGNEDPSDPSKTIRVLTIMEASEY